LNMKSRILLISAVLASVMSGNVGAKDNGSLIKEQFAGGQISFSTTNSNSGSSLTIVGPEGFNISRASATGMPSVNLYALGELKDGLYNYEITTNSGKAVLIKDTMNNGRGKNNSHYARKGVTQAGHFYVANGQIKQYRNIKESQHK